MKGGRLSDVDMDIGSERRKDNMETRDKLRF